MIGDVMHTTIIGRRGGGDSSRTNATSSPSVAPASAIASVIGVQTSTVKRSAASSPSASVAVSVYSVCAIATDGVPVTVRTAGSPSNPRPSGSAGDSAYVSGPLPPDAAGSSRAAIAVPTQYCWAGAVSVNSGTRSSAVTVTAPAAATVTWKSSVAVRPSPSVAVQMYFARARGSEGVPETRRPASLDPPADNADDPETRRPASLDTPAGNAGDSV